MVGRGIALLFHDRDTRRGEWSAARPGNEMRIAYSGVVFVALGTQHAMQMRCIVICGLPGCTVFFGIVS